METPAPGVLRGWCPHQPLNLIALIPLLEENVGYTVLLGNDEFE